MSIVIISVYVTSVSLLADLDKKSGNETEEGTKPRRVDTQQEEMKTDEVGQRELENQRLRRVRQPKAEERVRSPRGAAGSEPESDQREMDKKNPENHTEQLPHHGLNGNCHYNELHV